MGKDTISKGASYFLLTLGGILMLLPFIWMLSSSFQTTAQAISRPPIWIPIPPRWQNYHDAMQVAPFARYFFNSLVVAVLSVLGTLIVTILAAYAFARIEFRGKSVVFAILLATLMIPGELLLIPNFVTIADLNWTNTFRALVVPWIGNIMAIFLLRQYFLGIPIQLAYAAKVDGCRDFRFLWYVMVPLSKPALITITLLSGINSWNGFLWPLIVIRRMEMRTLPLGLAFFRAEAGGLDYPLLMAASVIVLLPMITLFLILQKHLVRAVSRSGTKG